MSSTHTDDHAVITRAHRFWGDTLAEAMAYATKWMVEFPDTNIWSVDVVVPNDDKALVLVYEFTDVIPYEFTDVIPVK